ncbi:NAD-dependent epimerase/dehydratase family protein [Neotabrizicola shimadae]|uniref:NAD-dependent epimerase/dehydratase family protein n=1 Tax=Neotabrizicola shimadae TaxID=2807096 RepID=A0A8G0ZWX1_9RHOB|nr:NAD-dependent epimerase/dehydratase family protein [Neotabrizicola shimadae]QYZ70208.1 NAD-dependent epimerase/dehydratase family protein [Neotabrizicola shimadae]
MTKTVLITGAAGFIGFHLARLLLADGWRVVGVDGMTPYYDPALKEGRLARLSGDLRFERGLIETPGLLMRLMAEEKPQAVVHLAAQAGVRYSIEAPRSYVEANLIGTYELLEAARAHPPAHMMLASTSSVYGANEKVPFAETDKTDRPMSFYAATKMATEGMAHSYAHLYHLPVTMFRFFTVYGPWGRPDMALFKFTRAILKGEPIDIYNGGEMARDFTYVEDLVEGIRRLIAVAPGTVSAGPMDSLSPVAPFRAVNIGNAAPVPLMEFVAAIERATGRVAEKNFLPMQAGDVPRTWASDALLRALVGGIPRTPLDEGVGNFVRWYRDWAGV